MRCNDRLYGKYQKLTMKANTSKGDNPFMEKHDEQDGAVALLLSNPGTAIIRRL
jgi:hypothetical protein